MAGSGLKTLCEELGVLEAVGDKEMGLKNRDLDDGTWGSGNWFPLVCIFDSEKDLGVV